MDPKVDFYNSVTDSVDMN